MPRREAGASGPEQPGRRAQPNGARRHVTSVRPRQLRSVSTAIAGLIAVVALSCLPLLANAWTGTVAYTSFEEPALASDVDAGFRDPLGGDSDHELSNGAGSNAVRYTACTNGMAELGFRTYYLNVASNVGGDDVHGRLTWSFQIEKSPRYCPATCR